LNQLLRKQIRKHKDKREGRPRFEFSWIYLSIALILVICIVTYYVIRLYMH